MFRKLIERNLIYFNTRSSSPISVIPSNERNFFAKSLKIFKENKKITIKFMNEASFISMSARMREDLYLSRLNGFSWIICGQHWAQIQGGRYTCLRVYFSHIHSELLSNWNQMKRIKEIINILVECLFLSIFFLMFYDSEIILSPFDSLCQPFGGHKFNSALNTSG